MCAVQNSEILLGYDSIRPKKREVVGLLVFVYEWNCYGYDSNDDF